MTERLYFDDPYRTEFEASVVGRFQIDGKVGLILDQTCFYPTAGGQQCDRGLLNDVPVRDVKEWDGDIIHVLEREIQEDEVLGKIDWERRFDFMQQHSGQHVLSQSFFRVLDANTKSAHLGEKSSTIEIARETLAVEEVHSVEDFANSILYENRVIKTYFVSEDEIDSIPLRRTPKKEGPIRIVEVDGLDYTPCGGTHCRHTGEIGLIKTGRWEKIRGHVRIQFLCGYRALREYRWKSEAIEEMADRFSTRGSDVLALFKKQEEENRELRTQVKSLTERALEEEVHDLLAKAASLDEVRIVKAVYNKRPSEEMKTLATRITIVGQAIALLGNRGEKAQLVFSCSDGLPFKMNDLMNEACSKIDGRGGGSPKLAFGGGPRIDKLEEAIQYAYHAIMKG